MWNSFGTSLVERNGERSLRYLCSEVVECNIHGSGVFCDDPIGHSLIFSVGVSQGPRAICRIRKTLGLEIIEESLHSNR